jgi:hypothetical protein
MPKKKSSSLIPAERIEKSILLIRGQKVLLDADLAELYGVHPVMKNVEISAKSLSPLSVSVGITSRREMACLVVRAGVVFFATGGALTAEIS